MRIALVALSLLATLLAGCTDEPEAEDEEMAQADLPDPIHQEGMLAGGHQIAEWDFLARERVEVAVLFTPDTPIEYAAITVQDCETLSGSGTGAIEGGLADHTDTFSPGHGCITVEARHTEPFDYTLDVTFTAA